MTVRKTISEYLLNIFLWNNNAKNAAISRVLFGQVHILLHLCMGNKRTLKKCSQFSEIFGKISAFNIEISMNRI